MMNLGAFSWRNTPWIKATRPQWRYALRNGIAMCLALTVAYYLNLERKNRKLYDKVRKMDEAEIDFSMNASLPELQDQTTCYWSCFWSNTEKKFYLPLLAVVIIPPLVTAFPYIMNMLGFVPKP